MKVSLKGLPDTLRGAAWPTSACAVRWPVKSGNRQDPHLYYLVYNREIALVTRMKVWATLGEYSLNPLGDTRASMVDTTRRDSERRS